MVRAQLDERQWARIKAVLVSRHGELVSEMAPPTRQCLDDVVREHQEIQRQVVNVEPLVIEIHADLSAGQRSRLRRFSGTGTGTGTGTGRNPDPDVGTGSDRGKLRRLLGRPRIHRDWDLVDPPVGSTGAVPLEE